ncbi:F-box/RNI/FBD-like domain protein [Medicago truncatula]|uniref:F-box/RNI/FBD-like domain protein n=1 Tax=Medicago truncatula TaxID=3880 RepID=A0A072V4Q0_MEDTR|nr:F-box/RNI/FBD-like domain protein [Medicago truncatula]
MELFFCNHNVRSWGRKWKWMLDVLQHSPKLQHLTIHQEIENGIYEDIWHYPQNIPTCISSQLRTCLFKGCKGMKSELQFAEYVMQNSKVLSTMTIHSACSIDLTAKHRMLKKLAESPRRCKLIFD